MATILGVRSGGWAAWRAVLVSQFPSIPWETLGQTTTANRHVIAAIRQIKTKELNEAAAIIANIDNRSKADARAISGTLHEALDAYDAYVKKLQPNNHDGLGKIRQLKERHWKGNYKMAMEGCPPFHWLLQQHPLAFEAGIAVWIALFSAVILLSPRWLAMAISIAIVIGHTWGTSTWLLLRFGQGYWLCIALFFVSGFLASLCYHQPHDKPR